MGQQLNVAQCGVGCASDRDNVAGCQGRERDVLEILREQRQHSGGSGGGSRGPPGQRIHALLFRDSGLGGRRATAPTASIESDMDDLMTPRTIERRSRGGGAAPRVRFTRELSEGGAPRSPDRPGSHRKSRSDGAAVIASIAVSDGDHELMTSTKTRDVALEAGGEQRRHERRKTMSDLDSIGRRNSAEQEILYAPPGYDVDYTDDKLRSPSLEEVRALSGQTTPRGGRRSVRRSVHGGGGGLTPRGGGYDEIRDGGSLTPRGDDGRDGGDGDGTMLTPRGTRLRRPSQSDVPWATRA